ncbi:MAG TPA: HEAT repeat domain-containing protein, partial [Caulobacteraceae bacterium]|nr:HEAT repeat domain-containing protein [Caulobacteraceae bacterium]
MARLTAAPFAFAMSEDRDLAPKLARIGDHNLPIALGELSALSDLDQDEAALFRSEWPEFEPAHRRALAQAMQELGEESLELDFREAFVALLDDEDATVRVAAARGLNEDTRRSTLRRLLRTLNDDPEEAVQAAVATTLGAWTLQIAEGDLDSRASAEVEQSLLAAYAEESRPTQVRQRLLETLGYLGDQPAVLAAIEAAQRHPDETWQQSALCAMGHSSLKRWVAPIKQAFGHESPALRFEAVRAAGELADLAKALVPNIARLTAD